MHQRANSEKINMVLTKQKDMGWDFHEILKNRAVSWALYRASRVLAKNLYDRYFEHEVCGLENVPKAGGGVIATYHCLNFGWAILTAVLERNSHGLVEEKILEGVGFLGPYTESIPVDVDCPDNRKLDNARRIRALCRFWAGQRELIVVTTDGPTKLTMQKSRGIVPSLKNMDNYTGAASIARDVGVPVIPFASLVPPPYRDMLFVSRGIKNDIRYLEDVKKIKWVGRFGEPMFPRGGELTEDFSKRIRTKQIELEERIAID